MTPSMGARARGGRLQAVRQAVAGALWPVPAAAVLVAIGLGLTLIHLISIPITNTSVNPARSTGPALIQGGVALQQLWMFWVAPLIGGVLGGLAYRALSAEETVAKPAISGEPAR